jgi:tetratricopeptide (TPR) repeat protein
VRLVNTDEPVEILLAKGKNEDANKLAKDGLWARDLETLETTPASSNQQEEAYRLYNIGVANEALAYQSEDHAAAQKYLEEAAIDYGKAIDAKPNEKYFLQPQNRIETALAYYKKLEERGAPTPNPVTVAADIDKDTLTNEKVIEMFQSGVDEPTILSMIHDDAKVNFDLSSDAMIALAKAGIKGKIPAAMRERMTRKTGTTKAATK